jgi:hypothetical protein
MAAYCVYADRRPLPALGRVAEPCADRDGQRSRHERDRERRPRSRARTPRSRSAPRPADRSRRLSPRARPTTRSRSRPRASPCRRRRAASAIDLTTDGENFVFASELPWAQWMEAARAIDSFLPRRTSCPLVPTRRRVRPGDRRDANAELAAAMGLSKTGGATSTSARRSTRRQRLTRLGEERPDPRRREVDAEPGQPRDHFERPALRTLAGGRPAETTGSRERLTRSPHHALDAVCVQLPGRVARRRAHCRRFAGRGPPSKVSATRGRSSRARRRSS